MIIYWHIAKCELCLTALILLSERKGSYVYKITASGPRTEPWGTPQVTGSIHF